MKRLLILFLTLSLLSAGLTFSGNRADAAASVPEDGKAMRVTRFLLLGCDKSSGLTDSILVVSINETEHTASILQIPRDTYAEYTDRDYKKLNGAMQTLGPGGVKDFLSEAFGLPIHYFVVLKLDCFRSLVDAVGGVDVNIPQDMHYSDPSQGLVISLPKGQTHLNGEKAEQFVRYRSGYANADLGRLDAQKCFLRAFAKQCKSLSAGQMMRVLGVALCGVQTDIDLPSAVRVTKVLMQCDPDAVPMKTVAGQAAQGKSGAWYYVINREGASDMINDFLCPTLHSGQDFDPSGLFNRENHQFFHRIYHAPSSSLPLFE